MKIKFCWRLIFEILIFHKPSQRSCKVQHKLWARSVRRFDVNVIQTIRHTELNWSARVDFIIKKYVLLTIRENRKKSLYQEPSHSVLEEPRRDKQSHVIFLRF